MITLFTTTKDFNEKFRVIQLNAIRCWLNAPVPVEVIIFGRSKGHEELGSHSNLVFVDEVKTSNTGAPYADEMFYVVNQIAKYDLCCFVNADILLPKSFFTDLIYIHRVVRKNYLIVGERFDVDVDELLAYTSDWERKFNDKYKNSFIVHHPYGSDYFAFPKGQYYRGSMVELIVGRGGWDNWMIYNGRKQKYKVIDLYKSTRVIHQNHDYSHKVIQYDSSNKDPEIILNIKTIPESPEALFELPACNYIFKNKNFYKNYARNNFRLSEDIERILGNINIFTLIGLKLYHVICKIRAKSGL